MVKGRGSSTNPNNRFETQSYFKEEEEFAPSPKTEILRDVSKSILSENNSPDIGFRYSINPYRGCEHGCAYCYARPSHEYLGFSAGLDFESKIVIKENAAELLRKEFMKKSWSPQVVMMSGNTDCYQPLERKLELTRSCLKAFLEFRNPVSIITKNALVLRDLDLFVELNKLNCIGVALSVTTLNDDLAGALEPRTSRPSARLRAIEGLSRMGIPVHVMIAPVIPGLNDSEIPAILKAARTAGAVTAGYQLLRLPGPVLPLFIKWLEEHRPEKSAKILSLIREVRGGKLNETEFGERMRGRGAVADMIRQLFEVHVRKEGFLSREARPKLSAESFLRPRDQLDLF